jgi:penicillin-binding protein 2
MTDLFVNREYRMSREIDDFSVFESEVITDISNLNIKESAFIGKYMSDKILNIFLLCIVCVTSLLLLRSFYLQILKGNYYQAIAETNRTREKPLLSSRGLIYDSQKKQLVHNIPFFDAQILPRDLSFNDKTREEQVRNIAGTLGLNETEIFDQLNKHPRNYKYLVTIKENIDYEQALLLRIKARNIPGLYIETRNQRQYLYPEEFSHILGYEGKVAEAEMDEKGKQGYLLNDYLGKTGLELSYESILRGKYGEDIVEIDVSGQEKKVLSHQEPQNGQNLVLTIDQQVQEKVRDILVSDLKRYNKSKASLIMINPQNGEILALVSYPDFDNNMFSGGISTENYKSLIDNPDQPLFDRALKGEYPSGSVIKMAVAAGALQEKLITDRTSFMSSGGLMLNDRWFFPDWASGGHGATNVYRAIAWSVNTFFYIIGGGYQDFVGLGPEGLEKYYKLFGFGVRTEIDLPGEATGLVPNPVWKMKEKNEAWYIGDTYHMAIGQGDVLVTPLQIANYTTAFANGGKLYQPHLVKQIISNDGQVQDIKPEIIKENFIDQENLDIIKNAMRQTVTTGSAKYLNQLSVPVSGKTGTAQWNSNKDNHAWFTGFAPYENPEVVITVLVEEGGEGSAVSVPIAYDVLNWYFDVYKK